MLPSHLAESARSIIEAQNRVERRVSGLQAGARAYFLSVIAERRSGPLLVIAPTPREAEKLFLDLTYFLGEAGDIPPLEKRLHLFPSWEVLPFEPLSPHPDEIAARLEGLFLLLEGKAPILVASPTALMQKVIPPEALKRSYLYLGAGQELSRESLLEHLASWGFESVPIVEERGDFSVRGGIVDIYPPAYGHPLRLEFDGDRLESIREFDPSTQRSAVTRDELLLLPVKEFSLRREDLERSVRRVEIRAAELEMPRQDKNALIQALRDGVPFPGVEFLAPYFYPALSSVAAYLPAGTLVWLDQAARVELEVERLERWTRERATRAREEGRFAPPWEDLYLPENEFWQGFAASPKVLSEPLEMALPAGESALAVKSYVNADLHQEIAFRPGAEPSLAPLAERLKEWRGERVFFVAPSRLEATRLKDLIAHYDIDLPLVEGRFADLVARQELLRGIQVGELTQGFRLPEEHLVLVTTDEVFGTRRSESSKGQKARPRHFITSLSELRQDDYVVHLDHGIGIYRGLKFLRLSGMEGEFLHLEYEGGDRLYLPVDRINLVQKYIGGEGAQPDLDRLGGTSWERVKAKTRKSVLAMAAELVGIYAAREVHEGHSFAPPDHLYREFEASFEFEETPDQLRAIDDVLKDMVEKKPMDRLICGDVGYGKTEVALRAAFLAVMGGKQVAVLAPTTILAEQHLQTFRRRFQGYPVRVEMLSRFLTSKESRAVLDGLAAGTVDIVIGTHRLLQKDIDFRDLGLLIIDEEHRFGVAHKEKLKQIRKMVDVISLSATPIPRTLHMSLVGIRDMSIIETPPLDRLAVRTTIARYDEGAVRDAVLRELERGGQVFFLHNRVETIVRTAQKLADLIPEAKIAVAHGQMRPKELEKVMTDFLENRTQVLVCSAIIESGLDFPNANTIIINRADRLGLAQLYQLRGRVGRSHRRAYAYLMIPGEKSITRDAERRLRALQELDGLGGGFKLAVHDLEIRGAGNLLGKEQSGQIAAVGFELYTQMMKEAIQELKGEAIRAQVEPEIRLGIAAYFPENYIPDANQRILFYKRLASLRDPSELEGIAEEIRDRFGPPTPEVENLFRVMNLRRVLREFLVEQIDYHDERLSIRFHALSPVKVERLLDLINRNHGRYRLSPDGRLSFIPKNSAWEALMREVTELLSSLS
jgi:transcription-repair coupling factor (superfamily II helicase)